MLRPILRKIKFLKILNQTPKEKIQPPMEVDFQNFKKILKNLQNNIKYMKKIFGDNSDINIREFAIGKKQIDALIVNIEGMSEKTMINENIMGSLMWEARKITPDEEITIEYVKKSFINVNNVKGTTIMEEVVDAVLSGDTAFFLDGSDVALLIDTKAWEHRGVEQPQTESVVRGPREGFTETLRVNTSLVRRKIKDTSLKMEIIKIGRRTRTDVCIVYIKNLADNKIVKEVMRRLKSIDIDAILESGYIEEFIEDAPFSVFSTVSNTESPDRFAAKILEGRVGILVDGTPFALTVPMFFIESFQSSEDYYSRPFFASQVRFIRFLAFHITLFLPGMYVAIATFHPNIVPIPLLITMASTHEGIPFPTFVEALLMLVIFEGLREAGVRMPRPIGQAVSIVGALVLGEAAVNAGIASYPVVIVIALSGIMSFLLPPQVDSVTMLRFPILILGTTFGLFGIVWSYLFIIIHLASLHSFGVPYMSPLMPFNLKDFKDVFIRVPWWLMKTRPKTSGWRDLQREDSKYKPSQDNNRNKDDLN